MKSDPIRISVYVFLSYVCPKFLIEFHEQPLVSTRTIAKGNNVSLLGPHNFSFPFTSALRKAIMKTFSGAVVELCAVDSKICV